MRDSQRVAVSGVVEPVQSVRDVGFSSGSGALASRAKAAAAKVERERRRQEIEGVLAEAGRIAANLHVDLVMDAQVERELAAAQKRPPDKDTMDRGMKAAKVVMDRLAPVVTKLEGDVTVNHVFEAIAAARRGQ